MIGALERVDAGHPDVLAVLTYHRIADPDASGSTASLYVSPKAFEEHLEALTQRYTIISADDLIEARSGRRELPRHALLLTFDDAYVDFATTAWPMLRERSLPALLFVPTGYPDQPGRWFWWDRLGDVLGSAPPTSVVTTPLGDLPVATREDRDRAYRLLRDRCKRIGVEESMALVESIADQVGAAAARNEVLGWDALRALADDGVTIAAHSRTHALLTTVGDDQLADELAGSRADIERELGRPSSLFAYPSGDADQRVVDAAAAAGYEVAFTTRRGVNDLRRHAWLALRRVNVGHGASATLLRAQVGRWMALADRS
ncbi:MAG TPA: polysaccharide deacetylase family protein [Candidatus Limnocylindria bacterium]